MVAAREQAATEDFESKIINSQKKRVGRGVLGICYYICVARSTVLSIT